MTEYICQFVFAQFTVKPIRAYEQFISLFPCTFKHIHPLNWTCAYSASYNIALRMARGFLPRDIAKRSKLGNIRMIFSYLLKMQPIIMIEPAVANICRKGI